MEKNIKLNGTCNTSSGTCNISSGIVCGPNGTSSTVINNNYTEINHWSEPKRVSVEEVGDTIEMIYKQHSTLQLCVYPPRPPERRVYKIIYSCVDGKWNKSDRIFGKIIPATEEEYEFDI